MKNYCRLLLTVSTIILTGAGCRGSFDWSPDGKRIAMSTNKGILIADVSVNQSRLLPGSDGGIGPVWSTSGNRIAYSAAYNSETYIKCFDLESNRLTSLRTVGSMPLCWQQQDNVLTFVNTEKGSEPTKIVSVNAIDGTERSTVILPKNLEVSAPDPFSSRLLPVGQGEDVVFLGVQKTGSSQQVNLWRTDSGECKRITSTSDIIGANQSWDGQSIWYLRYSRSSPFSVYFGLLKVQNDAGTHQKRIALPHRQAVSGFRFQGIAAASISPTGRHAVLLEEWVRPGNSALKQKDVAQQRLSLIRLDGSSYSVLEKASKVRQDFSMPGWAGDGTKLALINPKDKYASARILNLKTMQFDERKYSY